MAKPRTPSPGKLMDLQTPLHAYAPGELAKLTPLQRERALRRSKRPQLNPALTRTIFS